MLRRGRTDQKRSKSNTDILDVLLRFHARACDPIAQHPDFPRRSISDADCTVCLLACAFCVHSCEVIATDCSECMVDIARRKAEGNVAGGGRGTIVVEKMDVESLRYPDGHFDTGATREMNRRMFAPVHLRTHVDVD